MRGGLPPAIPLEFIAGLNRDLIEAAFRRRRESLAIVGAPQHPAHEDTYQTISLPAEKGDKS